MGLVKVMVAMMVVGLVWGGSDQPAYAADDHLAYYVEDLSFYPPFPLEGSSLRIPGWEYGGDSLAFEDRVLLTSDVPSRNGWLWSENPIGLSKWEGIFAIKISGKNRLFGDGLAFWATEEPKVTGDVMGYMNKWKGLGVIIDTYDNNVDNRHPYLSVVVNDGNGYWDHANDGGSLTRYGCRIKPKFRNKGVLQVVVSVFESHIQVLLFDEDNEKWYDCVNVSGNHGNKFVGNYFGFTASTGSVSDRHEVLSFELYDMKRMEEDGGHHEHASNAESSADGFSFFGFLYNLVFYVVCIVVVACAGYFLVLFIRTKTEKKKKGPII